VIQELTLEGLEFLIMLIIYVLGIMRERARKPKPPPPPPEPNLRCGCSHQLSFHDGFGACHQVDMQYVRDAAGSIKKKKNGEYVQIPVTCACKQYTGDLPADWYARESLSQAVFSGELPPGTELPK
jgi:hypothetical protein